MGGSAGGIIGGTREILGRTQQRRGERGARREFSRSIEDYSKELEGIRGRVAPYGPLFTETAETAGARLKDVDRAIQNVLGTLGGLAAPGEPTGIGAEVLSRQRGLMGRGLEESQRAIRGQLAQRGMAGSGLEARLLSEATRGANQAGALAETELRQQALRDLAGFAQQQQAEQLQLLRSGPGFEMQRAGMETDILNQIMAARSGRAGIFGQMASRGYGREMAANEQLMEFAKMGGRSLGAKGAK